MPDVFINYRTGDGDKTAITIETALSARFGSDRIFRAAKSIKPGEGFPDRLLQGVRRSGVLIAVIGQQWREYRELHDEQDWVRKEIAEAIRCGIPVIPVIEGRKTDRLRRSELPEALGLLADLQSVRFDSGSARTDLAHIGDRVAELIPELTDMEHSTKEDSGTTHHNEASDVHGPLVQGRDFSGPFHLGKGNINQSYRHDDLPGDDER